MVKESFVSALEAEDRHTVTRVRDFLGPDADDNTIAAYAVQHGWAILTADDDYLSDDVLHGLLFCEDGVIPSTAPASEP
jgi:predicted nuclease of predicted toxin-antitoxin system